LPNAKQRLEAFAFKVVGPTNHEIMPSGYFFNPNGHRVELTCVTATMLPQLDRVQWQMLDQ